MRERLLTTLATSALFLAVAAPALAQAPSGTAAAESMGGLRVAEAKLGTAVEDRMLVGETNVFDKGGMAYLWMRVVGGPSDPITVTWTYGEHEYPVDLRIGGNPWRTWSSKILWGAGTWTLRVTDSTGNVLKEMSFEVSGDGASNAPAAPAEAAEMQTHRDVQNSPQTTPTTTGDGRGGW